jgi:histidyl-tRNA synthetase
MAISAKPPSGTRDFLPAAIARRRYVLERIERAYQHHGFVPLETPAMERLDVLTAKYGEEGDGLIFTVLKRREKLDLDKVDPAEPLVPQLSDLALRYDLTVPLARVVAAHQQELPKFFKRYQVQPVWRADRPQKGRFREFYQCDVDFVGTRSVVAEVTVVSAVVDALTALGFDAFTIRINDRRILTGLLNGAGIPASLHADALIAVDKLDKIGEDGVLGELTSRGIDAAGAATLLRSFSSAATDDETFAQLDGAVASDDAAAAEGISTLRRLVELLRASGVTPCWRIDPSLARGLSYYTGPIFEIAVEGLNGSMGGGGRYDELVGMFRGQDVPAVGFSLGLERLLVVMEDRGMFPAVDFHADVLIAPLSENEWAPAQALARVLHSEDTVTEVYPETAKLGKMMQYAEQGGCGVVAILGSREAEAGEVGLKHLASGQQVTLPWSDVARQLRAWAGAE